MSDNTNTPEQGATPIVTPPVKRGPGRPRKNPLVPTPAPTAVSSDAPSDTLLTNPPATTDKPKRGRPKKKTLNVTQYTPDENDAMAEAGHDVENDEMEKIMNEANSLRTPKGVLRQIVSIFYQTQRRRIALGNQMLGIAYASMGFIPGQKISDEELKEKSKGFLIRMEKEFYSIHEQIADLGRARAIKWFSLQQDSDIEYITNLTYYTIVETYFAHRTMEAKLLDEIKACLYEHPIWVSFMQHIKGCGPLTSAMIISFLDIHKAVYPSGLIAYCGYDVVAVPNPEDPENPKWEGRSRKKAHLKEVEYRAKDGTIQTKLSCGYNPTMKTTMYKLATCFIKQNPEYKAMYDNYKHRQQQINEQRPPEKRLCPAHLHARAMRYIIKEFLKALYNAWRPLEGLYVHPPYEIAKLGMKPHRQDYPAAHVAS